MKKSIALSLALVILFLTTCILPSTTAATTYSLATPRIQKITEGHNCNRITWTRISGADKYRVFIRYGTRWKKIGDTTSTTYNAKVNGREDSDNQYTVRCISADGTRFTSDYDPIGYYCHHTGAPLILSAEKGTDKSIWFNWSQIEMPYGSRYRIFIRKANGTWKKLTEISGSRTSCKLMESSFRKKEYQYPVKCDRGTTYAYQITVRAVGGNGNYISDYVDELTDLCLWYYNLSHISMRYYW